MEFVVDKVSEDSFYENLLIGLPKVLENLSNISEPYLERSLPVQYNILCAWEQKNGVLLPEDLRSFYGSVDGLLYFYKFYYKEKETDDNAITSKIEVNPFNNLVQIYGYEMHNNAGVNMEEERYILKLGTESKVFELVNLNDAGKVVLVYINSRYLPNIWILTSKMEFYFLADDFTTYLRMCIHHLGVPFWQFAYTKEGIPDLSEMVLRLLVPAILPLDNKIEDIRKQNERRQVEDVTDLFINKIDSSIFRMSMRVTSQNNTASMIEQGENNQTKKRNGKPRSPTKLQRKPLYHKKTN